MSGGIFLIKDNDELVRMDEAQHETEALFQKLLANYPDLLAGDQMNPDSPRKWLLIAREFGVPGEDGGSDHWSLDHLFLDQDGIPTLVEVKRSTDSRIRREVVGQLWHARTVEADLGMRWNAHGIVEAAERERIPISAEAQAYAARVAAHPDHLARGADWTVESELATAAATIAVRRHGRPLSPGEHPRPLADVGLVLGSGGVLRHSPEVVADQVLGTVIGDHGGGWRVPTRARMGVDGAYVLFAIGLLADDHPEAARALADQLAS